MLTTSPTPPRERYKVPVSFWDSSIKPSFPPAEYLYILLPNDFAAFPFFPEPGVALRQR